MGASINDLLGEKYGLLKDTGFSIHPDTKKFDIQIGKAKKTGNKTATGAKVFNVEYPERGGEKFSVAKRAISDFKDLQPSPEALADVMLYLPESACELTYRYGDFSEQFYNAAYNNYTAALKSIAKNGLLDNFILRAKRCVTWASPCGYGFADDIASVYEEYYLK